MNSILKASRTMITLDKASDGLEQLNLGYNGEELKLSVQYIDSGNNTEIRQCKYDQSTVDLGDMVSACLKIRGLTVNELSELQGEDDCPIDFYDLPPKH